MSAPPKANIFGGGQRRSGIRRPAPPSRRSIADQGLHGCLTPNRPAKWQAREGPPRFLQTPRCPFQPRLACCRGSREDDVASPLSSLLDTARQIFKFFSWLFADNLGRFFVAAQPKEGGMPHLALTHGLQARATQSTCETCAVRCNRRSLPPAHARP